MYYFDFRFSVILIGLRIIITHWARFSSSMDTPSALPRQYCGPFMMSVMLPHFGNRSKAPHPEPRLDEGYQLLLVIHYMN